MATYTWSYSMVVNGQTVSFDVVYDDSALSDNITITATAGSLNVNALWFSDGDANAGDYGTTALSKSDNSLNMNGSGETWDGYQKISSAGLTSTPPDSFIDASGSHNSFTITADATFLAAFADAGENLTLGVRATSVNGGGSIKAVDDEPDVDDGEIDTVIATDDDPACGVEGLVKVTGNVLDNDTDSLAHDLDITHVNDIALSTLDPTPDGTVYEFAITDGILKIDAETGAFEFTYTGPGLPVGEHWDGSFTYTITDGDDTNDSDDSDHTATVDLCIDAAAGSQGYWANHDASGPQANDWDIAENTSFETYFGVAGPYSSGQWDITNPVNGSGALVADITLRQSLDIAQGGSGGQNHLASEATVALLNFLDEDMNDAFVTAYIYQRANFAAADAQAADDLSGFTDAQILADLKTQVQDAFAGAGDAYSTIELTNLLLATHE
jgi:hypothetical protein